MRKILVIGCPGSGKSTFSRSLRCLTGLPLYHLDQLYWNADRTTVDKAVFRARLEEVLARDEWILDGNYASTLVLRLEACDTVFFLDYSPELCLEGIRERRGKPRDDLPWSETEPDEEFLAYVRAFPTESRPVVTELLARFPEKEIHIFTHREQADTFLSLLKTEKDIC